MMPSSPDASRTAVSRWRIAAWSAAALLLLVPLVAMQFTDDVDWTAFDFAFVTVLLLAVGVPLDLVMRRPGDWTYRAGAAVALGTAFLVVWVNGAVGIVGAEDSGVNLLLYVVLAVGVVGAVLARFRPHGLARAMAATALAQAAVAVGALVTAGASMVTVEVVALAGLVGLWSLSALCFRAAARRQAGA